VIIFSVVVQPSVETSRPPRRQNAANFLTITLSCAIAGRARMVANAGKILMKAGPCACCLFRQAFRGGEILSKALILLVGVAGFEPATPSSRTRCATRLRYTPLPVGGLIAVVP